MSDPARLAAVRAHAAVLDGRSLDAALLSACAPLAAAAARSRARAIAFDACRWHGRWAAALDRLLSKGLRRRERLLRSLFVCALVEIEQFGNPAHAVVNDYVAACGAVGLGRVRPLLNAVLRRFLREREALLAALDQRPASRWAQPPWLLGALRADWPAQREALLVASNARAPMTLRVNRLQGHRAAALAALAAAGQAARPGPGDCDLQLERPVAVAALPGFERGDLSVQDSAAQWAATLLDPRPGMRVLDACAAPGGKSGHLQERAGGALSLLALDASAERLRRVEENMARLSLPVQCRAADAGEVAHWWDGRPFERLLLDAPCSGSGVIRRHPDIKLLRRAADIEALAACQARLLAALWPTLAPGGRLLYATCSVLRAENEQPVQAFLRAHPEARARPITLPCGRPAGPGWQILPGEGGCDGFYYALLERRAGPGAR